MRRSQVQLLMFSAALIAIGVLPSWCQNAVLKGKVMDAVQSSPIAGADVSVVAHDGKVLKTTISGKYGDYSVEGLPRGAQVIAKYRKGGYSPDPRPYDVPLSNAENVQDARLYASTADSSYWGEWSVRKKQLVDAKVTNPEQRGKLYDAAWSNLSEFGLPADAQAEAARQLVVFTPTVSHSPKLLRFASVDPADVQTCTVKIQAAVQASAALSSCNVPQEVVTEIAANELRKQSPSKESEQRFLAEYRKTWGEQSAQQLNNKLSNKENVKLGDDIWEETTHLPK